MAGGTAASCNRLCVSLLLACYLFQGSLCARSITLVGPSDQLSGGHDEPGAENDKSRTATGSHDDPNGHPVNQHSHESSPQGEPVPSRHLLFLGGLFGGHNRSPAPRAAPAGKPATDPILTSNASVAGASTDDEIPSAPVVSPPAVVSTWDPEPDTGIRRGQYRRLEDSVNLRGGWLPCVNTSSPSFVFGAELPPSAGADQPTGTADPGVATAVAGNNAGIRGGTSAGFVCGRLDLAGIFVAAGSRGPVVVQAEVVPSADDELDEQEQERQQLVVAAAADLEYTRQSSGDNEESGSDDSEPSGVVDQAASPGDAPAAVLLDQRFLGTQGVADKQVDRAKLLAAAVGATQQLVATGQIPLTQGASILARAQALGANVDANTLLTTGGAEEAWPRPGEASEELPATGMAAQWGQPREVTLASPHPGEMSPLGADATGTPTGASAGWPSAGELWPNPGGQGSAPSVPGSADNGGIGGLYENDGSLAGTAQLLAPAAVWPKPTAVMGREGADAGSVGVGGAHGGAEVVWFGMENGGDRAWGVRQVEHLVAEESMPVEEGEAAGSSPTPPPHPGPKPYLLISSSGSGGPPPGISMFLSHDDDDVVRKSPDELADVLMSDLPQHFLLASQLGLPLVLPFLDGDGFHAFQPGPSSRPLDEVFSPIALQRCFPRLETLSVDKFLHSQQRNEGLSLEVELAVILVTNEGPPPPNTHHGPPITTGPPFRVLSGPYEPEAEAWLGRVILHAAVNHHTNLRVSKRVVLDRQLAQAGCEFPTGLGAAMWDSLAAWVGEDGRRPTVGCFNVLLGDHGLLSSAPAVLIMGWEALAADTKGGYAVENALLSGPNGVLDPPGACCGLQVPVTVPEYLRGRARNAANCLQLTRRMREEARSGMTEGGADGSSDQRGFKLGAAYLALSVGATSMVALEAHPGTLRDPVTGKKQRGTVWLNDAESLLDCLMDVATLTSGMARVQPDEARLGVYLTSDLLRPSKSLLRSVTPALRDVMLTMLQVSVPSLITHDALPDPTPLTRKGKALALGQGVGLRLKLDPLTSLLWDLVFLSEATIVVALPGPTSSTTLQWVERMHDACEREKGGGSQSEGIVQDDACGIMMLNGHRGGGAKSAETGSRSRVMSAELRAKNCKSAFSFTKKKLAGDGATSPVPPPRPPGGVPDQPANLNCRSSGKSKWCKKE
eukprot:jgi/Mesvir1/1020/Mv17554-RA.1